MCISTSALCLAPCFDTTLHDLLHVRHSLRLVGDAKQLGPRITAQGTKGDSFSALLNTYKLHCAVPLICYKGTFVNTPSDFPPLCDNNPSFHGTLFLSSHTCPVQFFCLEVTRCGDKLGSDNSAKTIQGSDTTHYPSDMPCPDAVTPRPATFRRVRSLRANRGETFLS